jgi:hypothetical protein
MINDFFEKIWGFQERRYSAVIAQSLGLSKCYRDFLEYKLDFSRSPGITSIETEKPLGNGQIDILVEYDDGFVVGIENKKWAGLQHQQLHRYTQALKKEHQGNFKLVLLAPSSYKIQEMEKPQGLFTISYKEIIEWIQEAKIENEIEAAYLQFLMSYIEVLEMKPFDAKEVTSLLYYSTCLQKLEVTLEGLRKESDGRIENSAGNYKLFLRPMKDFQVYIGVRFGRKWYFNADLLNDLPECVVYIKDIWSDREQQDYNKRLECVYLKLKADSKFEDERIDFYPRKKSIECRLVIRRSLQDFESKNISDIVSWFTRVIEELEAIL